MNARLFSDEIRERERRRRRKDLLWSVASFVLHVAVFAAIVMMTPVKSLVFDKEKKKANPAADLSADRIEQIADSLSQARINELLRQLEALQAVLHNMDLMKEELQKDYDAFAAKSAESLKETLAKTLDEVEAAQKEATAEQSPMIGKVEKMLAEERLDLTDEERSKWLHAAADDLIMSAGDKVAGAQARAGNALDRIQVQAEFGGYRKTAEASGKVRDAQIEAATMQNQAQKEASEIGYRMGDMRGRVKDLENHEKWLASSASACRRPRPSARTPKSSSRTRRSSATRRSARGTTRSPRSAASATRPGRRTPRPRPRATRRGASQAS